MKIMTSIRTLLRNVKLLEKEATKLETKLEILHSDKLNILVRFFVQREVNDKLEDLMKAWKNIVFVINFFEQKYEDNNDKLFFRNLLDRSNQAMKPFIYLMKVSS